MHKPIDGAKVQACMALETNPLNYKFFGIHVIYNPITRVLELKADAVWTLYLELVLDYLYDLSKLLSNPSSFVVRIGGLQLLKSSELRNYVIKSKFIDNIVLTIETGDEDTIHDILIDAEFYLSTPITQEEIDAAIKARQQA